MTFADADRRVPLPAGPHHPQGDGADADGAADGVAPVGEQVVGHGAAHHAHRRRGPDVGVGEHRAGLDAPVADRQVVRPGAGDRGRPALTLGGERRTALHHRGHGDHRGALGADRLGVLGLEAHGGAGPDPAAAGPRAARGDVDQVAAQGGDLALDRVAGAAPDRHQGGDRRHADDHPQRRQQAAQGVAPQAAQAGRKQDADLHATGSRPGCPRPLTPPSARGPRGSAPRPAAAPSAIAGSRRSSG